MPATQIIPAQWKKLAPPERPFITLKVATTLDGKLAASNGQSKWISDPQSRQHAQQLRAEHQAILVGHQTIIADNPQLTVRHESPESPQSPISPETPETPQSHELLSATQPIRIILDSKAQLALQNPKCLAPTTDPQTSPILAVGQQAPSKNLQALRRKGIRVWQDPTQDQPSLPQLLKWLKQASIHSILVEGGATTHTSFIKAATADALALYLAPSLMGQSGAPTWCQDLNLSGLQNLPKLQFMPPQSLASDIFLLARFLR